MDIPTELFSTVYAIDDGFVRIPGPNHDAFSDGVVQVLLIFCTTCLLHTIVGRVAITEHTGKNSEQGNRSGYSFISFLRGQSLFGGSFTNVCNWGQIIVQNFVVPLSEVYLNCSF